MTALSHLRPNDHFNPAFVWQANTYLCADLINNFHPDDYPKYAGRTAAALLNRLHTRWSGQGWPQQSHLQSLPYAIFQGDKPAQWRKVRVVVGRHRPPGPDEVPTLMRELYEAYRTKPVDYDSLTAWYRDFETVHPFLGGNGRVGGCVVPLLSYRKNFNEGQFLPPCRMTPETETALAEVDPPGPGHRLLEAGRRISTAEAAATEKPQP